MLIAVPVAAAGVAVAWPLRRVLVWNGGLGLAVYVAGGIRFGTELAASHGMPFLAWLATSFTAVAVPTAIGVAVRVRRESEAGLRAAQALRAVAEERLRMAQELHDSVGHGLAVIAMQAGVALHVLERNPGKARESLEAIQAASRESLHGMRVQLDVLRPRRRRRSPTAGSWPGRRRCAAAPDPCRRTRDSSRSPGGRDSPPCPSVVTTVQQSPHNRPASLSSLASPAPSGAHSHRWSTMPLARGSLRCAGRAPASTAWVGDSRRIATAATLSGWDRAKSA